METYTLPLVDDEEEVIQIILKKINWEGLGFRVIGYADNGIKALEMVEEYQPDVVMTDIRMPYMDGIDLCKSIRLNYPATKILFFTGFDEFEYAKEAIHLEIEEYILKPLNAIELTNVLTQLKIKLDQEIYEKRSVEILHAHYMDSLPFLKANFYSSLIEGKVHEDELEKYLLDYQISLLGPYYCCIVIHTSSRQIPKDMNPQLLMTSVYKQVKEQLTDKCKAKCFSYLENTILIAQLENEGDISELTDECDKFCRYIHRVLGAVTTIGLGQVCNNILELPISYSGAREAVSYRVIYGTSKAINIKEIAPQETNTFHSKSDDEISLLFKMIRLGTKDDVVAAVESYFKSLFTSSTSLQQYQIAIMELISALYRFSVNNDISDEEFQAEVKVSYSKLFDMEQDALKEWLINISLFFNEQIVNARHQSTKSIISNAKEYVRVNYKEEGLSLDDICDTLGVSNSYFSTIFKKETGKSFIGYLTDYRMDKAARQLVETNEKSYIIAKNVGYTDPNYFSYVFKRRFGVSPSKYRTEYAKSEE